MRYDLTAMVKRTKRTRRSAITMRPVTLPATLASDLYAEVYAPVLAAWSAAVPEIINAYEAALAALTTDSPERIGMRIDATELTIARIIMTIRLRLERWAVRVEQVQRGKWRGAVLSATGVDIGTMIGAGDMRTTIGGSIERNVGLVRSVSEQARTRIGEAVFQGLTQRQSAAEVAKSINGAVDMGKRRARNIASDQLTKISSQLAAERAREAGLEFYEWVHSGKVHPREEHRARNGKRFKYGEPVGDEPGFAPFCGCTSRAVLSLDSEF